MGLYFNFNQQHRKETMKYNSSKCGGIYLFKAIPDNKKKQPENQTDTDTTLSATAKSIEENCLTLFNSSLSPIKQSAPRLCEWVGNAYKKAMQKKPQDPEQQYEYYPTGGRGHKLVKITK